MEDFKDMWNCHTIRGPRTEGGRGGGVPSELFQDEVHFELDDELVDDIGVDMYAAEPGLERHEPQEAPATAPPASRDPLFYDTRPDLTAWLTGVREEAMAAADRAFHFRSSEVETEAVMEYQFFLDFTLELRGLTDALPYGAPLVPSPAWAAAGAASKFGRKYKVRRRLLAAAQGLLL